VGVLTAAANLKRQKFLINFMKEVVEKEEGGGGEEEEKSKKKVEDDLSLELLKKWRITKDQAAQSHDFWDRQPVQKICK